MCSIGWIKLKDSWAMFKNRDRPIGEKGFNWIIQDRDIVALSDRAFQGIWIGVNKFGIGINFSYGPIDVIRNDLAPEPFKIAEDILRKCKTIEEGKKLFLRAGKKIGRSLNVLICNSEKAVALELIPGSSSVEEFSDVVVKTNHFTKLTEYNTNDERVKRSDARLRRINMFMKGVKKADDIINILGYCKRTKDFDNVCRQDYNETVASAVFEVGKEGVTLHHSLNKLPSVREFGKTEFIMSNGKIYMTPFKIGE